MATLRVEVLGLSSGRPLVKGFSAALLEVGPLSFQLIMIVCGADPTSRMELVWVWFHCRQQRLHRGHRVEPDTGVFHLLLQSIVRAHCSDPPAHLFLLFRPTCSPVHIVQTHLFTCSHCSDPPATVHLPEEDLPPTYRHPWIAQWPSGQLDLFI